MLVKESIADAETATATTPAPASTDAVATPAATPAATTPAPVADAGAGKTLLTTPVADAKADDTKGAAAAKADAPIELKFPDGFAADETALGEFKAIAKELGLDSAKAQKVADVYAKAESARAAKHNADFEKMQTDWVASLKADKDFGGEKFEANTKQLSRAMHKYGTPELTKLLDASGLGSHPELVKFVHRVSKDMKEDSIAGSHSTAGATPATSKDAFLRQSYPSMFPKE